MAQKDIDPCKWSSRPTGGLAVCEGLRISRRGHFTPFGQSPSPRCARCPRPTPLSAWRGGCCQGPKPSTVSFRFKREFPGREALGSGRGFYSSSVDACSGPRSMFAWRAMSNESARCLLGTLLLCLSNCSKCLLGLLFTGDFHLPARPPPGPSDFPYGAWGFSLFWAASLSLVSLFAEALVNCDLLGLQSRQDICLV